MQGKRVVGLEPHEFKAGDFGRWMRDAGNWYARTPSGELANLGAHRVTEHEDGTITVSPSILVTGGESRRRWHGYLRAGVWETLADSDP